MRIVHLSAEFFPVSTVGGLAEVVSGLANGFAEEENVEVIIPKYSFIELKEARKSCFDDIEVFKIKIKKVDLTLIDSLKVDYFKRKKIYGYKDDEDRFIYFSNISLQYLLNKGEEIDILHLHDWHTSLSAALYKDIFKKKGLKIKKIVLTIHNVKYQGECSYKKLNKIKIEGKKYIFKKKFFLRKVNLLACGVFYSDKIVAVSPTYSKEILTKKQGYGLQNAFLENRNKLTGILNGIDISKWDPMNDPFIRYHFSNHDDIKKIFDNKRLNKQLLQKKLKMKINNKPLISFVGRLVPQKGPALVIEALKQTFKCNGQFIILGSSTIKSIQRRFKRLKRRFKLNKDVSINFLYDEELSHLIYAASDFMVIPSLFEPCGLVQMISFRYGTIPIAREIGGLKDTVFDEKNGFTFKKFSKRELRKVIKKSINFWEDHHKLDKMIKNMINENHSWDQVKVKYFDLYKNLLF
ncbi:MAG: hypothetical protein AMS24_05040 [Chlamydiae bacterium SM23_39]|nr:MAG: hypothetical protein AMS24_05040 [Chlamydiae bacterium SM23_39]